MSSQTNIFNIFPSLIIQIGGKTNKRNHKYGIISLLILSRQFVVSTLSLVRENMLSTPVNTNVFFLSSISWMCSDNLLTYQHSKFSVFSDYWESYILKSWVAWLKSVMNVEWIKNLPLWYKKQSQLVWDVFLFYVIIGAWTWSSSVIIQHKMGTVTQSVAEQQSHCCYHSLVSEVSSVPQWKERMRNIKS